MLRLILLHAYDLHEHIEHEKQYKNQYNIDYKLLGFSELFSNLSEPLVLILELFGSLVHSVL